GRTVVPGSAGSTQVTAISAATIPARTSVWVPSNTSTRSTSSGPTGRKKSSPGAVWIVASNYAKGKVSPSIRESANRDPQEEEQPCSPADSSGSATPIPAPRALAGAGGPGSGCAGRFLVDLGPHVGSSRSRSAEGRLDRIRPGDRRGRQPGARRTGQ